MTLLDAQEIDPAKARKRKQQITLAIVFLVGMFGIGLLGFLLGHGWWFRYWPDERIAGHFFASLQKQDYNTAYGIWWHDPQWQQHPDQYAKEVSLQRVLSRLGPWRRVGPDQDAEGLWRGQLSPDAWPGREWYWNCRGRCGERPRRTRTDLGGEVRQDTQLPALRSHISLRLICRAFECRRTFGWRAALALR